ncbi:hypothetical protein HYX13_02555 [Candidatus Woesearchaeota archaeon]|nr:hypothetical protein [Candidatus Woesearchaeota archaeon]
MQQKGDLEKYLHTNLDTSILIDKPQDQETLFGEEFELKKHKSTKYNRWVILGVDYEKKNIISVEAFFYTKEFTTAQQALPELSALAGIEKVLASYDLKLDEECTFLTASGKDLEFIKKVVQCINGFLK